MYVLMRLLKRNKKPTRRKNKNRLTFPKPNERRLVFKPPIVPYIVLLQFTNNYNTSYEKYKGAQG